MRYVIVGAGAVGGSIGALLHEAGTPVVLVARGAHLQAMREHGLRFITPDGSRTLSVGTAGGPDEVQLGRDDVLVLTTKTQDTASALDGWSAASVHADGEMIGTAGELLPVVCAQNAVENERLALRRFASVYAVCVWLPSLLAEPGVVAAPGAPRSGMLHIGRYPDGVDDMARAVARELTGAGFEVPVRGDVMRWKYGKLLRNLANAFDALIAERASWGDLADEAVAEGNAALQAAGIAFTDDVEEAAARAGLVTSQELPGVHRGGGSTWQSLARRTGSLEVDYLNGEIVLLGRLNGVPTPVNSAVQRLASSAARTRTPPRSIDVADLRALVDR